MFFRYRRDDKGRMHINKGGTKGAKFRISAPNFKVLEKDVRHGV